MRLLPWRPQGTSAGLPFPEPSVLRWEAGSLEGGVLGGAEARLCCRTAQKHCCVSYLKEKSCMAGVLGAKEGEACGDEDNDTCGVSLYKASCPGARGLSPQVLEGGWSGQAVGPTPGGGVGGALHLHRKHRQLPMDPFIREH